MKRYLVPMIAGIGGTVVLLALGNWQVERLAEKEAYLASIEARISEEPVPLPARPNLERDKFLSVAVRGSFTGEDIDVLASRKGAGAGYRVISAFRTDAGRRILIDRGFLPVDQRDATRDTPEARLIGNLHWPDEIDSFTPKPDMGDRLWFARDVPTLSAVLDTESVLLVLRESTAPSALIVPFPVDTTGIPNDHLEYAVTWFSLAAVWFGMTLYLLWRIRRRTV